MHVLDSRVEARGVEGRWWSGYKGEIEGVVVEKVEEDVKKEANDNVEVEEV